MERERERVQNVRHEMDKIQSKDLTEFIQFLCLFTMIKRYTLEDGYSTLSHFINVRSHFFQGYKKYIIFFVQQYIIKRIFPKKMENKKTRAKNYYQAYNLFNCKKDHMIVIEIFLKKRKLKQKIMLTLKM